MSNGANQVTLSSCGCCAGEPPLAPISNAPGQTAIAYRLGTYGVFFQRLLDGIGAAEIPDGPNQGARPLQALTTRSPDDPTIALLDAWAVVADVLTFYQERIANEGYLRTATERRSVLELAREIGYELNPGVAASVYLQFTVQEIAAAAASAATPGSRAPATSGPGGSLYNFGVVDLPKGVQAQSSPAPGALPQPFETANDLHARVEWNALAPRLAWTADIGLYDGRLYLLASSAGFANRRVSRLDPSRLYLVNPQVHLQQFNASIPAIEIASLYLQGTATNLKAGDRLLFVGANVSTAQAQSFVVQSVETQTALNRTKIGLDAAVRSKPIFAEASLIVEKPQLGQIPFNQQNVDGHIRDRAISESDLQAFLSINGWDAGELEQLVNNPTIVADPTVGVFAFRANAGFFGANATKWLSLPDPSKAQRGDPYPLDWDRANDGVGRYVWTDSQGQSYQGADVYLERQFPQATKGGYVLMEADGLPSQVFQITKAADASLADYGLSGKATGLSLNLPSPKSVGLQGPAAVSRGTNLIDVFAIGLDGALCHRWFDGNAWNGPENLGGASLRGTPATVSWAPNRLDVFAVTGRGALMHWWWDGGSWSGPENLGNRALFGSPAVVSWAPNRLDVFAVTAQGSLVHWWYDNGWASEDRGGQGLMASPSVVSLGQGQLDVFANAVGASGGLRHWSYNGIWTDAQPLGGALNLQGAPSAVKRMGGGIHVVAIGADGGLYYWGLNTGSSIQGPQNLATGFVNSACALSVIAGAFSIFAITAKGELQWLWAFEIPFPAIGFEVIVVETQDLGGDGNLIDSPAAVASGANQTDVLATSSLGHWRHARLGSAGWSSLEDYSDGSLTPFPVRTTKAFLQTEQLAFADIPIEDPILGGATEIMLDGMTIGLQKGQAVALSGLRADAEAVPANEILILADVSHIGGYTRLQFQSPLQYAYLRATLAISANVTLATHGTSVTETLGNGDASQTNQTFRLKRPPLTYVSASTPSGSVSSLEIRVNDLEWTEASTLYGLTSKDQSYVVRLADDGTPSVTFGAPAARLTTGAQNVRANYRTGVGLVGNVAAGTISMLMSRPPGLRAVTNPLPASGGADPQTLADARSTAPLTVLTLDRIVSLDDYENFARSFAGIGKAQAVALWSGQKRLVHITIAGADGGAVDPASPLYAQLAQAINLAHDPVQQFMLGSHQPLTFNLTVAILVDTPRYLFDAVEAQTQAALTAVFSFANRAFAQPVTAAEILALVQAVPGVVAANVRQLYLSNQAPPPSQDEPPAVLPATVAYWSAGAIVPAQLLLINPVGLNVTEMAS